MPWAICLFVLLILLPCCLRCHLSAALRQGKVSYELRIWRLRVAGNKAPGRRSSYPRKKQPELFISLPAGRRLLGMLFRHLRLERLRIFFLSAFSDPWETVRAYNMAGLCMTALQELAGEQGARMELRSDLDFDAGQPSLEAALELSAPLWPLSALLWVLLRQRRKQARAIQEG